MGLNNFLGIEDHYCQQDDSYFEIISIPYERTTSYGKGTSTGPDAIIKASQYVELYDEQFQIEAYKKGVFTSEPVDVNGTIETVFKNIEEKVSKSLKKGKFPISLGGEHTITYAILAAFGKDEPVSVIHLDAHGDTAVMFGGTRVSDASIFQLATVEGVIDPERTIQIGMRGRGIYRCEFSQACGMRMIKVEEFKKLGVEAVVQEARNIVGDGPLYLTIDTDVFDCAVMPGTTLPEPFGLSGEEVRDIIRGLRGLNIVGADLMELSPPYDATGMSACLASGIAFELLCLLAESCAIHGGMQRKTHWH